MKRQTVRCCVAVLAIMLAACDDYYEAEVPIDPTPQERNDPRLLGEWRCVADDPDFPDAVTVTFSAASERTYRITLRPFDEDEQSAFGSTLNGLTILNIKGATPGWLFSEYALLAPNVLRIRNVSGRLLEDVPSSAVRSTIERLRGNPGLYTDDMTVCVSARRR